MKFPFFASFIMFCAWLGYELHKHRNLEKKSMESFWEKEYEANRTRRKSLDDLEYITIPLDTFPMSLLTDDSVIIECRDILKELSKDPIVNLTGISNTDLKLKYGAPNINLLTDYDQRYTVLVRTLQNFGKALYDKKYIKEAQTVLEFAVSTRTDISSTYKLLTSIYKETGQPEKILELLPVAESLNSGLKNSIVKMLKEETLCI
ncbi:MAG: hypothetical protein IJ029_07120 [Lachnospiraceae bacterium]|nr:hypothetical protein [Lachnospiraceae bacterium]